MLSYIIALFVDYVDILCAKGRFSLKSFTTILFISMFIGLFIWAMEIQRLQRN